MRCLICDTPFWQAVSFRALGRQESEKMCHVCQSQLEPVTDEGCKRCGGKGRLQRKECYDCVRWSKWLEGDVLERNCSLFYYNNFLKTVFTDYKYRGDVALYEVFASRMAQMYYTRFSRCVPVVIPLSPVRLKERGFNQSALFASEWTDRTMLLERAESQEGKQSKRTRRERIALMKEHPFMLVPDASPAHLAGKDVVVIDDIYTTGTTARQAARVLLRAGAQSVSSLTVARA